MVLEGLAAGLPMIVARRGGIPEIARDAALYFDPTNMPELVHQLTSLLDSADYRREMSQKARAQAERWSWVNQYRKVRAAVDPINVMKFATEG